MQDHVCEFKPCWWKESESSPQEPVLNKALCGLFCNPSFALCPISPANFLSLPCPFSLLTSINPHLSSLRSPPTPPVHPDLGSCRIPSWHLLGIAGLMAKLNFTGVFKLIESSAWVMGNSGTVMYLIWVFKSAFAAKSRALDLGGSGG